MKKFTIIDENSKIINIIIAEKKEDYLFDCENYNVSIDMKFSESNGFEIDDLN